MFLIEGKVNECLRLQKNLTGLGPGLRLGDENFRMTKLLRLRKFRGCDFFSVTKFSEQQNRCNDEVLVVDQTIIIVHQGSCAFRLCQSSQHYSVSS